MSYMFPATAWVPHNVETLQPLQDFPTDEDREAYDGAVCPICYQDLTEKAAKKGTDWSLRFTTKYGLVNILSLRKHSEK